MIELTALLDKDGAIILYDIYIDGEWCGSRRTAEQCYEFAAWVL